jgi:SAM-dependent methyltransferase
MHDLPPVTHPYSALAAGYDAVMAHVDYPMWAAYAQGLIRTHRPGARSVVELGCGTGTFAVALQPFGPPPGGYVYRAYDGSEAMVEVARETARRAGRPIAFDALAFGDPVPGDPADVVVLLYDGLNYLLDLDAVTGLLRTIRDALAPGGIAIVDQSTPVNSETHAAGGFDDAGETDAFSYLRTSEYDAERRLHTTTFDLTLPDGRTVVERHVQRAYSREEVAGAIEAAGLVAVAAYDGFEDAPADDETERVHWVLRRATPQGRPA